MIAASLCEATEALPISVVLISIAMERPAVLEAVSTITARGDGTPSLGDWTNPVIIAAILREMT